MRWPVSCTTSFADPSSAYCILALPPGSRHCASNLLTMWFQVPHLHGLRCHTLNPSDHMALGATSVWPQAPHFLNHTVPGAAHFCTHLWKISCVYGES